MLMTCFLAVSGVVAQGYSGRGPRPPLSDAVTSQATGGRGIGVKSVRVTAGCSLGLLC